MIFVDHLDILDLSETGIHVICPRRVEANALQRIRIERNGIRLDLSARVVRSVLRQGNNNSASHSGPVYEVAMHFERVTPEQIQGLKTLISMMEACRNS